MSYVIKPGKENHMIGALRVAPKVFFLFVFFFSTDRNHSFFQPSLGISFFCLFVYTFLGLCAEVDC